ncbi:hypothetical protein ACJ51O_36940 (plasmid) [Burkholderia pyrrocinia]|uniref:hypothetical protein n=1 Tax=Burkholderia pyrrocinia TaxID=60550 RepID=UPI0038B528E2
MSRELRAIVQGLNSIARQHGHWFRVNPQCDSPELIHNALDELTRALNIELRFYDAILSVEPMSIGTGMRNEVEGLPDRRARALIQPGSSGGSTDARSAATGQARDQLEGKRAVVARDLICLGDARQSLEWLSARWPVAAESGAQVGAMSQGREFLERDVGALSTGFRRRFPLRYASGDDAVDASVVLPIQATIPEQVVEPTRWRTVGAWGSHWLVHVGVQAVSKICGSLASVVLQHLPETAGCIGGHFMVPLAAGASGAYVGWRLAGYVGDEDPGQRRVWAAVLSGAAGICSIAELMAEQPTACLVVIGGAMQHVVISWIEPLMTGALRDCGPRPVSSDSVWASLTPFASSAGSLLTRAPLVVTRPVGSWTNALVVDLVGAMGHAAGDTIFRFWIARRDVNASRTITVHRAWIRWPNGDDVVVRGTASTAMSAVQILVARAFQQGMQSVISMNEPGYPIASMTMSVVAHDLLHQPLVLCEGVRTRSRRETSSVVGLSLKVQGAS